MLTKTGRALAAEFLGTLTLVATVIGSGIMGQLLSNGNSAIALLLNTAATTMVLYLLIANLGPISGAHFNPVVSLIFVMRRKIEIGTGLLYSVAQILGAILGAALANLMFGLSAISIAQNNRFGANLWLAEIVATAGLILTILLTLKFNQDSIALNVAAWIGGAYLFTSSTSFANPAVTVGRMFSNSFAGIEPASVGPFILAQFFGALVGLLIFKFVLTKNSVKARKG
ncbi:hypothetical protein A4Z71_00735 [Candidatus Rhodoluna planktonica]|uniref:Antitoxin n=1 Tax=Candidatus Rhodoluna planktonica TaxID=535712 RepID=A0A1D9E0U1_9MICO|nr:hypothetical protein A4Z71_00735 [Candidatus Rhodoluna planktonica]